MRISQLTKERRPLKIDFEDGDVLNIVYNPAVFTPALEEELTPGPDDNFKSRRLAQLLSRILVEWDLTEESGAPYGTTEEDLVHIPIAVLGMVSTKIAEDIKETTRAEGKPSGGGSPQTVS